MGVTADAYARMLKALLPPGKVWRLSSDSVLSKVLLACGDELVRVEQRGQDLLREADPQQANEMLPDYERELGLSSDGTLEERRARVVAREVQRPGVRPVDYQQVLAPLLGQDAAEVVVIERGRAFAVLVSDDREIYRFFIYRDPAAPGTYDLVGAQDMVDRMAHSHTKGHVIESINCLCDDPHSLCDRDLLGV